MPYVDEIGYKGQETSKHAAKEMRGRAASLRKKILVLLSIYKSGLTPDEAAWILEESVLAIRPRFSELNKDNLILDTGGRRQNKSNKYAIVWKLNPKVKINGTT
jgi:hypothetical protein